VDVRESSEQQVSMLPGAIPVEEFERTLEKYRDRIIVTYCTVGYRSGVYARKLREQGLDAFNLRGSILLWLHSGRQVVDGDGRSTRRVHVYGSEWDLDPEGYESVW
jgi:rhodanese-related sulfurtransferase